MDFTTYCNNSAPLIDNSTLIIRKLDLACFPHLQEFPQDRIGEGADSLNLPELTNAFPLVQSSGLRCQLPPFNALSAERFVFPSFLKSESVLRDVNRDLAMW